MTCCRSALPASFSGTCSLEGCPVAVRLRRTKTVVGKVDAVEVLAV
jgi:hypothetical protein